jgi:TolB-like protein/DNA-binding winged helix-turn-helix (wHTH) protein
MTQMASMPEIARFGPYEVNVRSGEIRKFGIRMKLGEQPFRILTVLMERQGELVSREELQSQLWSEDTFVDFDHSLNSAVQRLRECLSDTAEKAQWIETVPRRGYRFAGTVEWAKKNGSVSASLASDAAEMEAREIAAPETRSSENKAEESAGQAPANSLTAIPQSEGSALYRWRFAVATAVIILIAFAVLRVMQGRRNAVSAGVIRSLAVLPLENLSGDASQNYFVDGMTDELITALAKNHALRVISRTSTMQYRGVRRPVREIARELGVDGILEGSVTRSANRVHLTVQLIYAPSDTHVWANSYDRDLGEAISLPTELSQTIAKEVRVAVSSPVSPRYINPAAHDLYLRGRYSWFTENESNSIQFFQQAIQIQPDYAAPWSGMADYYGGRTMEGTVRPDTVRSNWEADARKAVELDDSLADAHNSMAGWYLLGAWDLKHSEEESLRAIALNPSYSEAYHLYAYMLTAARRDAEAIEIHKRGEEIDPFSRPWGLGYAYYHARQFDAAISELRLREQADSRHTFTKMILSDAYHFAGRDKEALAELAECMRIWGDVKGAEEFSKAGEKGYKAAAEWRFRREQANAKKRYFSPFWLATFSGAAQLKEETLQLLEEAYQQHASRLIFIQSEPVFDFLHAEPRYQEIVRKMGLPISQ